MSFARSESYNELPLLPPAVDLETKAILRQTIASARALSDLKGIAAKILNQAVLVSGIVLQEARLSSEIENIVTERRWCVCSSEGPGEGSHNPNW